MRQGWWLAGAFASLALGASAGAQPAPSHDFSTYEMDGTVGSHVVGSQMTIDGGKFVQGHYFYASQLKDIPLTGTLSGTHLTLTEPGGGVFTLTLKGNGGVGGDGSSFTTSTGLVGTWSQDGKMLPVKLGFGEVDPGYPPSPRYGDVTTESDAAFEARASGFLKAVQAGDKAAAAKLVSYPLTVNGARSQTVKSEAAFVARFGEIFSPKLLAELKTALPHEMFVHDGSAMVANGAVWFDAKGASAINEP